MVFWFNTIRLQKTRETEAPLDKPPCGVEQCSRGQDACMNSVSDFVNALSLDRSLFLGEDFY
ncbi:hypothetical protein B9Z51_06780 [Limnohabitans sp. T6-5]|nr:hypothetical protein B9Z51_06780 [Limnohabitans sp. T6-5]